MKKLLWFAIAVFAITPPSALLLLKAQDARISIVGTGRPKMGIPDFRGAGEAQSLMGVFNQTLWDDVRGSGLLIWWRKPFTPPSFRSSPRDFQTPPAASRTSVPASERRRTLDVRLVQPAAQLNYLAFGYTAAQNGVLVLYGWLFDMGPTTTNAPGDRQALPGHGR